MFLSTYHRVSFISVQPGSQVHILRFLQGTEHTGNTNVNGLLVVF